MSRLKPKALDVRQAASAPQLRVLQAGEALRRKVPGVQIDFDPVFATPANVTAVGRFLSQPKTPTVKDGAGSEVRRFIDENAGLFGHDSSMLNDASARVSVDDVTQHSGLKTVVWEQQLDGIPLFKTILKANLSSTNDLVTIGSHFLADPAGASEQTDEQRRALVAQPQVTAKQAVSIASASVNVVIPADKITEQGLADGVVQRQRFAAPGISDTYAHLTWMPLSPEKVVLAWDVTSFSIARNEMYRSVVDATSGDMLYRASLTNDATDASFRVWADATTKKPFDSPNPMLPGTPTPNGVQGAEVPRQLVTLQSVSATASPNGWINNGGQETLGNNVDAHTDTNADNAPDLPRPNGGASRVFDFPLDLSSQAPSQYKDAATTHLFYICNWMHDQLYDLGFTETSRNFQTDNFSRGGLGSDALQADAQDGSGTNNANMSTPADGSPPRMQMYVFPNMNPDRDGDFDDVVVLHEYTHGLSNRLVGGGVGISATATGGMGEGWSDFYGLALLADPNSDPNAVYPGGSYATLNFASGMTSNYYYGIRRYPYSTDMSKNPLTFKDIDPSQASPHNGIPLSPVFGSSNSNPSEVHNVGEVWCMTLWECRAALITKYGAAGAQKILQLVTDGMKLSPVNPNLLQARDAVIQADLVDFGGANRNELWAAFAKRGMGASATAPVSSTTTGVVEAFDLPDDLSVTPTTTFAANGPVGGPFTPGLQTYTLTNNGTTNSIIWTAGGSQSWITASPAGGTLAPGASVTVTVAIDTAANALTAASYSGAVRFTNNTTGVTVSAPVTLSVGTVDYFTELFTAGNDTDNQSWLFTPNASPSFYSVVRTTSVTAFPTDPTGGSTLTLGDDSYSPITLSGGATVKLYGTSYPTLYVGSNGYVTFGSSDTTYTESLAAHFGKARVAALFDDLNPSAGGTVSWRQLADRFAVTFAGVPEYSTTNSNDFQIELFFDGRIRITCLTLSATDGLIGLSQGLGQPSNFLMSNFNAYPAAGGSGGATLAMNAPASTAEGAGILIGQGAVTLSAPQLSDVVVLLASTNTSEIMVPANITIPAGQTSATFDITVVDDALLDGTQSVVITASAAGFATADRVMTVDDNDGTGVLTISAPAATTEGAGTITATLTLSAAPGNALPVTLTSSDTTAVAVPATIVVPAGQTTVNFPLTVIDDSMIDGSQSAIVTAHVNGWTNGTSSITVADNENTNLAITLPTSITEGGTDTGTVVISGTLPTALVVSLSSNTISRLTVPATVTIAAGATSASFTLTTLNNSLTDGNASVTISAGAAGFTGASFNTTVLDNDVHHYSFSTIASTQTRGVPFSVTITALDVNGVAIGSYTGAPSLSGAGTGGAVTVTPTSTTAFTAGVWTGNVTVGTFGTNVVLTVSDGAGHTGASNAFNVTTGSLHHFAWSNQTARAVNAPAGATITAQDAGNNPVTSFNGTASLSGFTQMPLASSIVITEINPNTPDEIEFMNVGTGSVDISGWKIYIYDYDNGGTSPKTFTIPAGTVCASGQIFRLQEVGTAPGAFPLFYTGTNINWTSDDGIITGVMLRNASNVMVDFVCASGLAASAVTSPATIPAAQWSGTQITAPSNSTYGFLRLGSTDANTAGDWTTNTPSIGTINTGLSVPFSGPAATTISPTVTSAFASGVWTGNVSVLQSGQQVKLRADDGALHTGDSNAFDVYGTLSLSVPANAPEGSAPLTGTVSVSSAPSGNLTVTLTSSDTTAATVPATVTILSGQTSATFPITIIDDALIDGTQVATITAHMSNWIDASSNISVLDNETLSLTVFLPGTVTEGSSVTGTVAASGTVSTALTVNLSSGNTSRLTVPATVTIAADSSSVTFTATAVDNALTDGTASVTVNGTSPGYASGAATTAVLDNDPHHYVIGGIASPQTKGVGFNVSITAQDVNNNVIASYVGTPALTASGAGGAESISPLNASGFVNGVWSGQVTSFNTDTNVVLTASNGAGCTGTSNAFNVINPTSVLTVVEPVSPLNLQPGQNPRAQLVVGADGALYGTTVSGGASNQGSIFKTTTAGVVTTLANFYGYNGMAPNAGLILASDGNFYGTTTSGGANNLGTVFRMTPSGTLTTLVHLTSLTGTAPRAPLLQAADGSFYGTTSSGGSSNSGTIYKMTSSGVLTVLVNFTGTGSAAYGSSCQAGLIQGVDGNLYGVTSTGGSGGGNGTVFKVTTSGTFTSLASFTGTTGTVIGATPLAALVQASDGILYGTASAGGTGGLGTVFKITTAGVFTHLLSFSGTTGSFMGSSPQSALVQWATDGTLYGMTNTGGTNNVGTLFKVTTAGVLTTLRSLATAADGASPFGAFVLHSDGSYYGVCNAGGSSQTRGAVIKLTPSTGTNTFTRIYSFFISPPLFRNIIQGSDGNFYGGQASGAAGLGAIFKMTSGGTLSQMAAFTTNNFAGPYLLQGSNGNLYGSMPTEGTNGRIFQLTTGGTMTTLATLTGTSGVAVGSTIIHGMIQASDGNLYGVTSGGGTGGGNGTVFKITTAGAFTSLASFTGTSGLVTGTSPQTRLVEDANGDLWGTTQTGGAGNFGTVFKVSKTGTFTNLVQFTGTTGAFPGTTPNSNLLLASDGNFYGTTSTGGTGGFGTIFRVAPNGTFTSLVSFTNTSGSSLGSAPTTNLVQGSDGNLYGTTTAGGTGSGTVYRLALPSGTFTSLVSFTGTTGVAPGATPHATLRQGADGYFYGTTTAGGFFGIGTVFRINAAGSFQSLYTFGTNNDGGSPNINNSSSYSDAFRLINSSDGYMYGGNGSTVFRVHQQPAIQSVASSGVTSSGATLQASVIPNLDGATAYFQYGLSAVYGSQTSPQTLAAGSSAVPVTAPLAGLAAGVVYHYRLVTVTSQGTFTSADMTFATSSAPLVITGSFPGAASTGFTLDGTVNPLGTATTYYFEYGTSTSYGTNTPVLSAGSGVDPVTVNATVSGLTPNTTYHVRLVATNSVGSVNGDDQTITTLATSTATIQPMFYYTSTGSAPLASLFKAADGMLYGTTSAGGTLGSGTVFRLSQGGSLSTMANLYGVAGGFNGGALPQAGVVQAPDGNFYGTTNDGGTGNNGIVFKVTPAGQMTTLVALNGSSAPLGADSAASLTVGADGSLYGVTQNGGSSSLGAIFKVTTAGVFTPLASFTGTTGSFLGSSPRAALTQASDGNFYGTTATGGAGGFGTVFKMTPAGVLTTLIQFTGTAGTYPGATPIGALMQGADGALYGTTSAGGANNLGTVFRITTSATFTSLASFTGTAGSVLGSSPKGALLQLADGNLYGTTQTGGTGNFGTVFQMTTAGALTTLVNFSGVTGSTLGTTPQGSLIAGDDGALYGTTNAGGMNNNGTVYKVTSAGLFTTLVNFTAAPAFGRLIQGANGTLYGATLGGGGAAGYGTLFSAPIAGVPTRLATLVPVSGTTAWNARAGLLLGNDGNYYGTTVSGGTLNNGSVFSLTPAGVFSTLINFTGNSGSNPGSSAQAPLIVGGDGNLWGTTSSGGAGGFGTIFKTTTAGVQTSLVAFTGTSGSFLGSAPQGPLTLGTDGNYYGTTTTGGTGGGFGTVFKLTPAGALTTLVNFTGSLGTALGATPLGALAQGGDGNFYGVTSSGGLSNSGTVFKVTPAGVFTSLASFTSTTGSLLGSSPTGGLFAGADGCLYGVTTSGGTYGFGVLFRVAQDGSVTMLYSFSGRSDGVTPNNGLVYASDGNFYGGNNMTVYKFNPPPVALTAPASSVATTSVTLNGSITGESYDGTVYFEYGTTSAYGRATPEQTFEHGLAATAVSAAVTGLQPFLTYHYRMVAITSLGVTYGDDEVFSTVSSVDFSSGSDVPVSIDGFTAAGQTLAVSLDFAPVPGTILKLVDNTGFTPVNGTFNNLPNGGAITASFGAQTFMFVVNYNGGDGNDITLTQVTQVINFSTIPNKLTTDVPFAIGSTTTSGLPVSYAITSGSASATISGNIITLTGTPGAVSVTATQAGDGGTYGPALSVTRTFVVVSGSPFAQLSSGKALNVTLGIKADGTLWGWGYNNYGQLGNGTTTNSFAPTQIGTATNWKSISVGGRHVLAVKTDGTLWAWGDNSYGQIGDGTNTQRNSPVQIGALTTWSAVGAGYYHTVALKTDGTLWACGYNSDGQLGQGTADALTTHAALTQVGSVTTWASIVSGNYHLLATRTDGTLWGWGYNSYGQVGNGSTTTTTSPVQVGTSTNWTSLSAGYYHSLGVRSDGTLWTWGRNAEGQIGDATLVNRTSPLQIGAASNWKSVAAGGYDSAATKLDNSLWTWGYNQYGQLGQGFTDLALRPNVPVQVGTATNWSLLAPGYYHTVATRSDGTTWSWGYDTSGELGYATNNKLLQPVAAQFGAVASAVAGYYHTVVLKPDGTLWTVGGNSFGQLSIGTSESSEHQMLAQPQPGTQWSSVAAGGYHSAAVRSDGTLWTWGYNNYGQLGDGTTTQRNSAVQVGTDNNWASVVCGFYMTIGLRTDGTLWAWGYNNDGQMGNGTTNGSGQFIPLQVGNASDWASVTCGGYHVLATKQNGTFWGWGYNGYGQVGNGSTTNQSTPVQIGTATTWRSVSAGQYHSIATRNDGTLWTWGRNSEGEIGDGSTTQRSAPVQIGTATNWQSVAAGYYHSYATRLDGSLWSWGYDFYNQLGDGGTTNRTSPTRVGTSTGWGGVFKTLGYHTLVTSTDNSLWGCGYTPFGHTGYAWRNQLVPDLVLPALSPPQTLGFPSVANTSVGSTVTLGATSSSGLPVSYMVSGPGTLNGSRVTVNGPGLITVFAWQPGDNYFQSSDMATQSFNAPPPAVTTLAASAIGATSATLNGSVNPNGFATTAKFQSGVSTSYGTDTVIVLGTPNGTTPQSISTTLTGLNPGTTYHFRTSGTNVGGTTTGDDLTFTTVDPNLSDLTLSTGALSPAFAAMTTAYTSSVSNSVANTTVTAISSNAGSTLQVRVNAGAYTALTSGTASGALPLNTGANTIDVLVTAADAVTVNTYTITVTRRTLLQDWQVANSAATLTGDDDGDGIPNLAEYAFNLNPRGANPLPYNNTMATNPGDGLKYLMFTYPRRIAASDLTYTVQTSPNLNNGNWSTPPGEVTEVGSTPNGDGVTETVTVRIGPAVSSGNARRFVRVRITSP